MPGVPAAKSTPPPKSVLQLVRRFTQHQETYKQQAYNETQVRREFIDPFCTSLGCDVDNRQIDQLAYALYGLTDDEIPIAEEATL